MSQETSQQALVSVIIPSYNSGEFLGEAVNSALKQTYTRVEVLVVDDGSTDKTAQLVGDWRKKTDKVRYLKHEVNEGVSAARNTGIRNARGRYIAFLDADDSWLPDKLAVQLRRLDQLQADLIFTNWLFRPDDAGATGLKLKEPTVFAGKSGLNALIAKNYGLLSSALIKTSALENIGLFDETLASSEDYDLWLRFLCAGLRLAIIPEPFVCYRRHANQASARTYVMRATRLIVFKKLVRVDPLLLFRCPVLVKKLILHQAYQAAYKLLPNKG
jgi:glycosyltransferase involved in cell wall biosynthesis